MTYPVGKEKLGPSTYHHEYPFADFDIRVGRIDEVSNFNEDKKLISVDLGPNM